MSSKKDNNKLTLKKPVSIWYRDLKIPGKSLFTHIAKGACSVAFLDGKGVQNNLLDIGKDMGLKEDKAQIAWRLVMLSFTQALTDILDDYRDLFDEKVVEEKIEEAAQQFEVAVAELQIEIDADFFKKPQEVGFLNDIESAVCFWLEASGLDARTAKNLFSRVKQRFVFCLHNEWLKSPTDYAILEDCFDSPFSAANKEQIAWQRYNSWLIEQPKSRLFAESFGLDKVYVPLRAYYKAKKQQSGETQSLEREEDVEKHVVDLHSNMHDWLTNFDANNALRIIAGGPGSGKSTFAKVFAAEVANQHPDIKVIFIPLQYFSIDSDLVSALENFIKQEPYLSGSPLNNQSGATRLLLIFDGLDELASLGKLAEESARNFTDELIRTIDYGNQRGLQRQALVTGRDISVQSCETRFRKQGQYVQVLPYHLTSEEAEEYTDPKNLLKQDQRQLWWQNYSSAKGKTSAEMPEEVGSKSLQPITKEPLLNYLVALSYERQEIDFSQDTTLNVIYEDLLKAVFERKYAGGEHQAVKDMNFDRFAMVLESIAIAVWHGHGRTATEESIADYCEKRGLSTYLEEYKEGNKKGLNRLLTAFYFREADKASNHQRTFEFTHKSFGEYLIARCIFKELESLHIQLKRRDADPRDGKDMLSILKDWAELCGPTAIDDYLNSFIRNEAKQPHVKAEELQKTLARLLSHVIRSSLPMEKVGLTNFDQMLTHARNAEEALLAMHSACARSTNKVSKLHLELRTAFSTWLRRLSPQRDSHVNVAAMNSLNHLELKGCHLVLADFYGVDLTRSILVDCFLYKSNLEDSCLYCANLRAAYLQGAYLQGADLQEADLQGADLQHANLINTHLESCNLDNAKMYRARINLNNKERVDLFKNSIEDYDSINWVDDE